MFGVKKGKIGGKLEQISIEITDALDLVNGVRAMKINPEGLQKLESVNHKLYSARVELEIVRRLNDRIHDLIEKEI